MPAVPVPAMGNLTSGFGAEEKKTGRGSLHNAEAGASPNEKANYDSDLPISEDVQGGVAKVEAMASVWTKKELYIAYTGYVRNITRPSISALEGWETDGGNLDDCSIFLIFFMNSLQQQVTGNLTAYVTSAFFMHSLVSTIAIVSNLVGGALKLPIAKLLDMWGRAEGFTLMLAFTVIGTLLY